MPEPMSLVLDRRRLARYHSGQAVPETCSPRPYLHPICTLGGTVVSAAAPVDHPWHLGLSLAIQDVDGANFWGGPTYLRAHGYVDRADHGRVVRRRRPDAGPTRITEDLDWLGPDGRPMLVEQRSLTATVVDAADSVWALRWSSVLRSDTAPVRIGSPATHGRPGAGYGGLFWRAPRATRRWRTFTAAADGESAVHGSNAPWLALSGAPADGAECTLVFVAASDATPARRWFVRLAEYPGICDALAFDRELQLPVGQELRVSWTVLVADGALDRDGVRSAIAAAAVDGAAAGSADLAV